MGTSPCAVPYHRFHSNIVDVTCLLKVNLYKMSSQKNCRLENLGQVTSTVNNKTAIQSYTCCKLQCLTAG